MKKQTVSKTGVKIIAIVIVGLFAVSVIKMHELKQSLAELEVATDELDRSAQELEALIELMKAAHPPKEETSE